MSRHARGPRSSSGGRGGSASPRPSSGTAASRARRPGRQAAEARSPRSRATRDTPFDAALSRNAGSRRPRTEPVEGEPEDGRAHLLAEAATLERAPEPRSGGDRAVDREAPRPAIDCEPIGRPSELDHQVEDPVVGRPRARTASGAGGIRARTRGSAASTRRRRTASRRAGGCRPWRAARSAGSSSSVGRRSTRSLVPEAQPEERPGVGRASSRGVHGRPTVHSAHGCCRDDGRLLREAERAAIARPRSR